MEFALPGSKSQYGPDKTVAVEHIDLHLRPHLEEQSLAGVCTTRVRALDEPVSHVSLNAVDLVIDSVARDGVSLEFNVREHRLNVTFAPPIAAGETAEFAISYHVVKPRHGLFFVRPTKEYPNKIPHAWTQSQDENARFWFPCFDYPHAKQSTSTTVVVPKGQFALANGALIERSDDADTTTFVYRQDVPHPTYLMTLVVGPFVEVQQRAAGANKTPISYYVLPGREADGERAFAKTPEMIEVFEAKIKTAYPYARYSQIAVSDFIFGGMENTSATTQTDRTLHDEAAHLDFSSDPLVSHELAHQWFGDLLTCRDWSHAWLNEGFATYFECVWREADLGYDEYLYDVFGCVARYLDEGGSRYSRPIVCNRFRDPIELFDRHLYEKGGAVLHMLRGELGEARFWRSIARYVERNAQRNVETIDLIRAIEEETGRNMRGFFDQWVFRAGHPEIEVSMDWDQKRNVATVTIDQKQKIDERSPAFTFDVGIGFVSEAHSTLMADAGLVKLAGEKRVRIRVERAHETITVPLDAEPKMVRFDPGAFLLADVTYKFGADVCAAILAGEPDPVSRIRAARALAKDGSHRAREALAKAFLDEPFWGVLDEVAVALGKTRAPWAREILTRAIGHAHPKVRRGIADALGNFRSEDVATALLPLAQKDASYFVRAAALTSLGKTRDPRAFDVLVSAIKEHTWNGVVAAGAARGLSELADDRAVAPLIAATALGQDEGLRRAAVPALARAAALVVEPRTKIVDAVTALLDDSMFLVQLAAILAAESIADARLLPALDRLAHSGFDGRVRRDAMEAAMRIREAQKVPTQVTALRADLDALREDHRKLQEQLEAVQRT